MYSAAEMSTARWPASTIGAVFTKSAAFYDALYSWKDYPAEAARLRELIARHTDGTRLLDVACGTGKHLEQLQRWYEVEGLDLDPGLLDLARQRCPGCRCTRPT